MDTINFCPEQENEEQYIYRICSMKEQSGKTWKQIAEIINKELNKNYDESAYRKRYQMFQSGLKACDKQVFTNDEYLKEIREERRALEKEKVKLRDERIDYQKTVREEARKESFIELIERALAKSIEPFDYVKTPIFTGTKDMIVCLSDMHTGINIDNWFNKYNSGVLKQRLHKYLDEIIQIQQDNMCKECHIVLGGDQLSGIIHPNLRLQNNENVIEQLKIAVTYIGEFIANLEEYFPKVIVHSVSGNHSRISPKKDQHLSGEELDALIPFCLNIQFAGHDGVVIEEDSRIDNSINSFTTRGGKLFYVVHGDKDTPTNVVKNLTLMTGAKPDAIIMGHRHHNAYDTEHGVKVIQCGSVVGTDDYCVNQRISSEPEQCVVITTAERAVKCIYDIGLN